MDMTNQSFVLERIEALSYCSALAITFVLSLYVFQKPGQYRNDPNVIKRRFASALVTCTIGFFALKKLLSTQNEVVCITFNLN